MMTTVLIEGEENADGCADGSCGRVVNLFETPVYTIYDNMLHDPENDSGDIAIILRINGLDVATRCSGYVAEVDFF